MLLSQALCCYRLGIILNRSLTQNQFIASFLKLNLQYGTEQEPYCVGKDAA